MEASSVIIAIIIGGFVQYLIIRAAVISGLDVVVQRSIATMLGKMTAELTKDTPTGPPAAG